MSHLISVQTVEKGQARPAPPTPFNTHTTHTLTIDSDDVTNLPRRVHSPLYNTCTGWMMMIPTFYFFLLLLSFPFPSCIHQLLLLWAFSSPHLTELLVSRHRPYSRRPSPEQKRGGNEERGGFVLLPNTSPVFPKKSGLSG